MISFLLCCLARNQYSVHYFLLLLFFLSWLLLFTATLFPPPTSALVVGVWADPFVPTAILGETHFLFPLLLIIYSYVYIKMAVWRLNCEDKKAQIFFSQFLVWLALLLKMASSPSYLPAASPPPPPPPLPLFLPPPPLFLSLPVKRGALLGWSWLHSIPSALRVVRVMSHTCLTSHMHGQTCGLDVGECPRGATGKGGAVRYSVLKP